MRKSGQGMSVDHNVKPISTYLSSEEKSSPQELKKIISDIIPALGYSYNELHQYIKSNIDSFLMELLKDAESRGLVNLSGSGDLYNKSAGSSGNIPKKKEGCYIATLVYGDYEHPKVKILRNFRDQYLLTNKLGQQFVKFYYTNSPNWVKRLKNHPVVNSIIKLLLNIFCYVLPKK